MIRDTVYISTLKWYLSEPKPWTDTVVVWFLSVVDLARRPPKMAFLAPFSSGLLASCHFFFIGLDKISSRKNIGTNIWWVPVNLSIIRRPAVWTCPGKKVFWQKLVLTLCSTSILYQKYFNKVNGKLHGSFSEAEMDLVKWSRMHCISERKPTWKLVLLWAGHVYSTGYRCQKICRCKNFRSMFSCDFMIWT